MCGHTRLDKIRNECIRQKVHVAPIGDKIREGRLRWFGHVHRRPSDAPVRKCDNLIVKIKKNGRGRPRLTWKDIVVKYLKVLDIDEDVVLDRCTWRQRIHIADPI